MIAALLRRGESEPRDARRHSRALATRLLATTVLGSGAVAILWHWPVPGSYAAPGRLTIVYALLALVAVGAPLLLALFRRWRAASLAARVALAPAAIRETALFLQAEADLAWHGAPALLFAGLTSGSLWLLAHWPQAAALSPLRPLLAGLALGAGPLLIVQLVRRRRHLINVAYLRWCLAEQTGHAARQGVGLLRRAGASTGGWRTRPTAESFVAGGFPWRLDDLFQNALVFGQPGSGKTVCVLNAMLDGLLASTNGAALPIAGLVLDPKGDYRGKLERLCARHGRAGDLLILDPDAWATQGGTAASIRWNPLDSEDDALEIAARLITVLKMLGLQAQDSFFLDAARTVIRHAISLLRASAADGPPALHEIRQLVNDAGSGAEGGFYDRRCGLILMRFPQTSRIPAEVAAAIHYFESEFRVMPDRQRAGVTGTLTQLLDELEVEPIRSVMSGPSTMRVSDALDAGKILYVAMPLAVRPRLAMIVSTLIKLDYQNAVLRRLDKPRPSFFLCDEFQSFFTAGEGTGDSDFFQLSRQSRHANVVAAQNVSAFHKRTRNRDEVKNLFGNCAVKIFLRNTEAETNAFASALFGEVSMISVVPSEAAALDGAFRRTRTTYSRQARMVKAVPPETFARLAIPVRGDPKRQQAESIVHLASRGETRRLDLDWEVWPL